MGRRIGIALVGLLVGLSPLAFAEPAGARANLAHGRASCAIGGQATYSPPLTNTFQATKVRFAANVTCSVGATSYPGTQITGGTLVGQGVHSTGSCAHRTTESLNVKIAWKSVGGKFAPTKAKYGSNFGSGTTWKYPLAFIKARDSYPFERMELNLVFAGPCGATPTRTLGFVGSIEINHRCSPPIPTEIAPAQGEDGYLYWVLNSPCLYGPTNAPTGTITWTHPPDPRSTPACSGATNAPLVNTGITSVFGAHYGEMTNLWGWRGVPSGINMRVGEACYGRSKMTYTGDARYRPSTW